MIRGESSKNVIYAGAFYVCNDGLLEHVTIVNRALFQSQLKTYIHPCIEIVIFLLPKAVIESCITSGKTQPKNKPDK